MFQSRETLQKALVTRAKKVILRKNLGGHVDAKFIFSVAREAAELLYKSTPNPLISARVLSALIQRDLDALNNLAAHGMARCGPSRSATALGTTTAWSAAARRRRRKEIAQRISSASPPF